MYTIYKSLTNCCERVGSVASCDLFQVDVLRLRSEDGPHVMKVEQIVTQLEQADQVTQQTLDDMLCYTPTGKRKQAPIMEERRTNRRTLKPLQSTLLSEWEKQCAAPEPALTRGSDMRLNEISQKTLSWLLYLPLLKHKHSHPAADWTFTPVFVFTLRSHVHVCAEGISAESCRSNTT